MAAVNAGDGADGSPGAQAGEAAVHDVLRQLGIGRLFYSMDDAVIVSDGAGEIVAWNPAASRIFGYEVEEALALNVEDLVPERYRAHHRAGMERYARTGGGVVVDSHSLIELPGIHREGHEVMVEFTLSGTQVDGRRFAVAIMRDVSDKVQLLRDLETRNSALKQVNEALETFTYAVSHDLKEPVRAMQTFSALLEEDLAAGRVEDARDLARRTRESADRLSGLVGNLLDLARATGANTAHFRPTRLRDAFESDDCTARYRDLARERGAEVRYEEAHGTPALMATRPLLCQVIGNLVLNGITHNRNEPPHVLVRAAPADADATLVEVAVEDNGPGFTGDTLQRVREARTYRGGGFGLTLVQQAVERLGGRVWVGRSLALGGAAVHFTVPAFADGKTRVEGDAA